MRLNLSFLRIFPISLFFFFLDIKKGLDSLKPLFMRFPSHLIPNFPAKSLFLFFSHFKWLDTLNNHAHYRGDNRDQSGHKHRVYCLSLRQIESDFSAV